MHIFLFKSKIWIKWEKVEKITLSKFYTDFWKISIKIQFFFQIILIFSGPNLVKMKIKSKYLNRHGQASHLWNLVIFFIIPDVLGAYLEINKSAKLALGEISEESEKNVSKWWINFWDGLKPFQEKNSITAHEGIVWTKHNFKSRVLTLMVKSYIHYIRYVQQYKFPCKLYKVPKGS